MRSGNCAFVTCEMYQRETTASRMQLLAAEPCLQPSQPLGALPGISYQERANPLAVQAIHQGVDLGVHDGLAHQRQRAVPYRQPLLHRFRPHARNTCEA
jgi:hypothetical protein